MINEILAFISGIMIGVFLSAIARRIGNSEVGEK